MIFSSHNVVHTYSNVSGPSDLRKVATSLTSVFAGQARVLCRGPPTQVILPPNPSTSRPVLWRLSCPFIITVSQHSEKRQTISKHFQMEIFSPGEACWWTVHPASKQRSEGEKVRVGDDVIFVSVATERYLVSSSDTDQQSLTDPLSPASHQREQSSDR